MARKAIFVWESGLRGPTPAVFYDFIPTVNGKPRAFLASHEIPDGTGNRAFFPFEAESPDFVALAGAYPAPTEDVSK